MRPADGEVVLECRVCTLGVYSAHRRQVRASPESLLWHLCFSLFSYFFGYPKHLVGSHSPWPAFHSPSSSPFNAARTTKAARKHGKAPMKARGPRPRGA